MVTIPVSTSDSVVWDMETVMMDICHAMANNNDIIIHLLAEGPDLKTTGLYDCLAYAGKKFNYNLSRISIRTHNKLEQHDSINICLYTPIHFALTTRESLCHVNTSKDSTLKHFGIFIGRSNAPRLILSTYLHKHRDKTIGSFHYDSSSDFHKTHIGLEESITEFNIVNVSDEADFLSQCPIKLNNNDIRYPILKDQHNDIHTYYSKFFVEIVCETYYSGNTFFPTEKTWRPIAMKTPFIVHGPANFLHNLKKLGFRTFDRWWDEGYSEDPPNYSLQLIKNIILAMSKKTNNELLQMYSEMHDVLEHNYNTLINLKEEDFLKLNNE